MVLLMLVALASFACNIPTLPELSCDGKVEVLGVGLCDVVIKSDTKEYATTNAQGEYYFITNAKTLTIYPVKDGYIFEPKKAVLSAGENSEVKFVAIEIENLRGRLTLSEIIITPTSIMSSPDNYVYRIDGKECIKSSEITLFYNGISHNLNEDVKYLFKNANNTINTDNTQIDFDCGQNVRIGVLINAYFNVYNHEYETTYLEFSYLDINQTQTNADLQNGQVCYNLYGINNKARTFTVDITFVFDFIES